MSYWNMSRDCCLWDGVTYDEMTGHVIELDLHCSQLVGKIDSNSSLFQLSHLQRLDLLRNNFSNSHISPEFGRFSSLIHLDLSDSYFKGLYGIIPESIFHLPNLVTLELKFNDQLHGYFPNTKWNSSSFLRVLDLNEVNLSGNFLPESLVYITSLHFLSLAYCNLRGPIPDSLSNLTRLESLVLDGNTLNGTIPSGIFSFP
ncbi:hypothetical protein FXO38_29859 [Capsicum annuum]|uniref:Leucine-rich repeat-containing N-terminal plant-type domain-containing protein n=1 Tax=Capsicum annuum TaxID=4072 RepID=A0A2G2Y9W9_CAPAN|nr:hypothetical protein FXO38_29859 [Capsicum annuum]KAF3660755.1 hypothetical protein FXO37_13255 [Capsicum annuum]PHT66524.1 hypothetical protein T459_30949 [Capsicum annuum]